MYDRFIASEKIKKQNSKCTVITNTNPTNIGFQTSLADNSFEDEENLQRPKYKITADTHKGPN